jgi:predicted phosphodiesterase
MRVLVVSDVHANLAALEAVFKDAGEVDAIWCLGDTVGYGPQPNEVLEALADAVAVLGNHDAAAAGIITTEDFNPQAAEAASWTRSVVHEESVTRIKSTPEVKICEEQFTLVHGSLREPIWEYLISAETALAHFDLQETGYGLVGHSHLPMRVAESDDLSPRFALLKQDEVVELAGRRLVLNPGSVGQPRDGDPRASYALLDTQAATFTLRRAEYDIAATQRLMGEAGLPQRLIQRLSAGR